MNTCLLASATTCWAGIPFELHHLPQVDQPLQAGPMSGELGMMVMLRGGQTWVLEGRRQQRVTGRPGLLSFADGGAGPIRTARSEGEAHAVVFNLQASWQQRLREDGGPESFADLQPIPPSQTVLALALAIASEVESGAASGALYAESLSLALLRYAIERTPISTMRVRGSLSEAQRRRLARYIDENLCDDLRLNDLAALTGLQARHFSTLFRRAFGLPPHRYLVERRLARAAQLLSTSRAEIAEIALQLGFASQSHFADAFRKRYGVSPRRYVLGLRSTTSAGS